MAVAIARLVDTSYADDLTNVFGCAAECVVDSVRKVWTALWEVFLAAGFRVNWGPNKTACLILWTCKNAGHARALLEQEMDRKVTMNLGGAARSEGPPILEQKGRQLLARKGRPVLERKGRPISKRKGPPVLQR